MIRFPAEWEPQAAVLIAWPHATGDFSNRLASVEQSFAFIATTISQHQALLVVCRDGEHEQHIRSQLADTARITFIHAPTNDIWVRDTVFLTVEADGQPLLVNFRFNGWGGKYPHVLDNALNLLLLTSPTFAGARQRSVDFVLEGGSLESDGQGTLLTTRQCLLNPNRNPNLTQTQIETALQTYLGATRILWLDQDNLPGDDTDAHIDTLARFCSADTIAYTACEDVKNPLYRGLKSMETQLQALRTADGAPYHLVPLPLPATIYDEDGQPLPANYSNFLLINDAVMVPVYDDPHDGLALQRLGECFPKRKIIAAPCRPIVHQYGSLHCMTMQFPANAGLVLP